MAARKTPVPEGRGMTFLRSLIGAGVTECIKWPMFIDERTGYGRVGTRRMTGGRTIGFAHRVMCELAHGAPPTPKHEAAHECDNRGCVNPNHLVWKTRSGNQLDRRRNGTTVTSAAGCRGKLLPEQKRRIVAMKGQKTIFELADEYGVHYQTISRLQNHGFVEKGKFDRFWPDDDARLIQLRGKGLTIQQIATEMGRSYLNVSGRIQRLIKQDRLAPRF